jgi:hypothetical protein
VQAMDDTIALDQKLGKNRLPKAQLPEGTATW